MNAEILILKIIKRLNECDIYPMGCNPEEISQIESFTQSPLPEIYKKFLECMGRGAGRFFEGLNIFYQDIFEQKKWFKETLEECDCKYNVTDTDFIFASNQGYEFMFFKLNDDPDPPVYYYIECEKSPLKKYDRFSDFLLKSFTDTFGTI